MGLRGIYGGTARRLPWWAAVLAGLAAVALGASITLKPFTSIGVLVVLVAAAFVITGIGELTTADTGPERLLGALGIAGGIVVAAMPGASIRAIAIVVGVVLLAGGLLRIASALRTGMDGEERLIAGLSGLSRAIFGGLALSWPDVSLLVVALLVGPAIILFGIGQIAAVLRRRGGAERARQSRRRPFWLRLAGVVGALVVALGLLGASNAIHDSSDEPDPFYDAPADAPAEPGALLRSESFDRGIPDGARAWRILYTTTRADGVPAVASAIVVVEEEAPPGPRDVIAWAHGTTGFAEKCAPSLLDAPFTAGAMPALDRALGSGWVVVATDYVGLGTAGPHPYLIGEPSGRSVLDAVRATRALEEARAGTRTVVWGHSQSGGAALWTGIVAPDYAPDVNLVGVAALAPATEIPAFFENVRESPVGRIMGSYIVSAYAAVYDDVSFDDYVRPQARVLARETADRCLSGPEALVSVVAGLGDETWFSASPSAGPLGERLRQNIPDAPITAPLMVAQGLADPLVLPSEQARWAERRCGAGQRMEYRTYPGLDHVGLVLAPDSALPDDLIAWTRGRMSGAPVADGCTTVEGDRPG